MIPNHREWFNDNWTPAKHQRFLQLIEQRAGEPPRFRHSETPVFLPSNLVGQMADAGLVLRLRADQAQQPQARGVGDRLQRGGQRLGIVRVERPS